MNSLSFLEVETSWESEQRGKKARTRYTFVLYVMTFSEKFGG